jgi:hypothetical protein
MQGRGIRGLGIWGALGAACADPALDVPSPQAPLTVELEPAASPSAVPATLRARLVGIAGARPWLFRGELSEHHARAVRTGELPSSLLDRAVPLRFWGDAQGEVVQPLTWLDEGQRYTLALAGFGIAQVWDVAADSLPRAERVFPAPGQAVHRVAVQCAASFPEHLPALTLEPGAVPLRVSLERWGGANCVTVVAERAPTEPGVLPPQWAGTLLAPGAFVTPPPAAPAPAPVACVGGQPVLGACLEVLDDRVLVTTPDARLWRLTSPEARAVVTSANQRTSLVFGLAAGEQVELRGSVLPADGSSQALDLRVTTAAAFRHLVLSEVLANPLGPEPGSEWIELVNDSDRAVSLAGLWLEDTGGRAFLPEAELAPRETALLVNAGFRPSSLDAPLAPSVRLLELASLGARGLSNAGEALLLVGPEGVVSRFPAFGPNHAGRSIARRSFDAADDDPSAFAEHGAPGASPGAANTFD